MWLLRAVLFLGLLALSWVAGTISKLAVASCMWGSMGSTQLPIPFPASAVPLLVSLADNPGGIALWSITFFLSLPTPPAEHCWSGGQRRSGYGPALGKMSCSLVGMEFICLASPVPRTWGKACGFFGRSQFQKQAILTWVTGTQWHLGRELKPAKANGFIVLEDYCHSKWCCYSRAWWPGHLWRAMMSVSHASFPPHCAHCSCGPEERGW